MKNVERGTATTARAQDITDAEEMTVNLSTQTPGLIVERRTFARVHDQNGTPFKVVAKIEIDLTHPEVARMVRKALRNKSRRCIEAGGAVVITIDELLGVSS